MFGDDYVREIGHATENEARFALYRLLLSQYKQKAEFDDEGELDFVLQAARNTELGPPSTSKAARAFATENPGIVKSQIRLLPREQRVPVYEFLFEQYVRKAGLDQDSIAASLAAAVTNKVFGGQPTGAENQAFAMQHEELVEAYAEKLGSDDELCAMLSGAAYNSCYARYVDAGGSRGMFSNKFLAYVRAQSRAQNSSDLEVCSKLFAEICEMNEKILLPLLSMLSLGIFRPLPYSPDERQIYEVVHQFAIRAGVVFKRAEPT